MSVFLAPSPDVQDEQTNQFKAFVALATTRRVALLVSLLSAAGCALHFFVLGFFRQSPIAAALTVRLRSLLIPAFLPVWVILSLAGLTVALAASVVSGRLAANGGGALLDTMRDDPSHRFLLSLCEQMREAQVLLHPVFRLGHQDFALDIAAVSPHGVTFFHSSPPSAMTVGEMDPGGLKSACKRLSEQYSLPLLARVRFIQLLTGAAPGPETARLGPDWQTCSPREVGRLFPRTDGGSPTQEIAAALRVLFNLTLSVRLAPIPTQGTLPGPVALRAARSRETHRRPRAETPGKVLALSLLGMVLGVTAVYLLRVYDYEMAEKLLRPARALLRSVLPAQWQERFALGTETVYDESHVRATTAIETVRASSILGRPGDGAALPNGTEVKLIQERYDQGAFWYLARWAEGDWGWLPGRALAMRHLVRAGTPLYERPDSNAAPRENAARDCPVALLSVWHRPVANEVVTWSKISFLDKREVRYIRGDI